jgi:hypothetical protein
MSDDPRPATRVYVTVNEQKVELVPTSKLTWPEVREAKRVSGMALVDLEQGLKDADPDAWFAWIYVSLRRAYPSTTEAELEAAIGDVPMVAVIESVEGEASEVAAPDPPASPFTSASDEPTNENGSGETTPPLSTLETAGPLT